MLINRPDNGRFIVVDIRRFVAVCIISPFLGVDTNEWILQNMLPNSLVCILWWNNPPFEASVALNCICLHPWCCPPAQVQNGWSVTTRLLHKRQESVTYLYKISGSCDWSDEQSKHMRKGLEPPLDKVLGKALDAKKRSVWLWKSCGT